MSTPRKSTRKSRKDNPAPDLKTRAEAAAQQILMERPQPVRASAELHNIRSGQEKEEEEVCAIPGIDLMKDKKKAPPKKSDGEGKPKHN